MPTPRDGIDVLKLPYKTTQPDVDGRAAPGPDRRRRSCRRGFSSGHNRGILGGHRASNVTRIDPSRIRVELSKPRGCRFGMRATLAAFGVLAYTGNCVAWSEARVKPQPVATARSDSSEEFCAPVALSNVASPWSVSRGMRLTVYFCGIPLDLASAGITLSGDFSGRMANSAASEEQ